MNTIKRYVLTLFVLQFCITFCYAQLAQVYSDKDVAFKRAKSYFQNGDYALAYPLFKDIYLSGVKNSAYPTSIVLESKYYYITSGLKVNDATAEIQAKDFISLEHNNPRIQMMSYYLAEYYFRKKEFGNALTYYNKSNIDNLTNAEIATLNFHKAYILFTQHQFAEARPLFESIRQIPTGDYYMASNYYFGFISFSDKNYKDALTAFTVAEKDAAYKNIVPFYIAEIYYFQGDKQKALSYAEGLIKQGGQYYDLSLKQLVGHLYFEEKSFDKALPFLEAYVGKNEKVRREDQYELSFCYYKTGNLTKCIEGFKQLSGKEDSLSQNSMYLLADALLKTDNKPEARNAFLFCANNSSNAEQKEISQFSYAKLSYELNYLDIALKEFQNFNTAYPNSKYATEVKELILTVLSNTSNYKDALVLFAGLKNPSVNAQKIYPKVLYGRMVEQINDHQLDSARILLVKLIDAPYNQQLLPYAYFWKGELAYKEGKLDEAINSESQYLKSSLSYGEVNPANGSYILGYSLLKKGNYRQALAAFSSITKQASPKSTPLELDAYFRTADCYFMLNQFTQALSFYSNIVVQDLKGADYALFQKAVIAGAQNKTSEKVAIMKSLLEKYPQSALCGEANLEIANALLSDEKYAEATLPLDAILKDSTASNLFPQAYLKMGVCSFNLTKNEEALGSFTQLIKFYPNTQECDEAIDYIRNIFIANKRPTEFVAFMKSYGKSITTSEADSITYKSAYLTYDAHDFKAAITGFEQYIQAYPDGKYALDAHYYLAELYMLNKDQKTASGHYMFVADKSPNFYAERSTLQAARINYFELKDYASAAKYYALLKKLTSQQENRLEAMRGLVRCQFRLAKWKEAVDNAKELLLEKGAATDDKMISDLVIAKSLQADNELDKASDYYKAVNVLGKSEYSAEALYRVAEILFAQGKLPETEKAAFEVIRKMGSYEYWVTKSYILLGDIYTKQKDYFNAQATYKSVADNSEIADLKQEAQTKLSEVTILKNNSGNIEQQ